MIVTNVTGVMRCDVTGWMFVCLSFSLQTSLSVFNIRARHQIPANSCVVQVQFLVGLSRATATEQVKTFVTCDSENKKT